MCASMDFSENYLSSVKKQFLYYKSLGDKTLNQLNEEELFYSSDESNNSIAIIIKHLWGNMMSRWTNFMTEDGEKAWRKRDEEFILHNESKQTILEKWENGWQTLFNALDSINAQNFSTAIYIRNMGHSIPEAINRQLCHYAYHVGQMVLIAKTLKKEQWQSLSIAKGASKDYNKEKFSKEKRNIHFTDDL